MLKFVRVDNDFCRVYYRCEGKLYCFQEDVSGGYAVFACTRDGEPSHPVVCVGMKVDRLPIDDCPTAKNFNEWALGRLEL